jgi:hypothetical protein
MSNNMQATAAQGFARAGNAQVGAHMAELDPQRHFR